MSREVSPLLKETEKISACLKMGTSHAASFLQSTRVLIEHASFQWRYFVLQHWPQDDVERPEESYFIAGAPFKILIDSERTVTLD